MGFGASALFWTLILGAAALLISLVVVLIAFPVRRTAMVIPAALLAALSAGLVYILVPAIAMLAYDFSLFDDENIPVAMAVAMAVCVAIGLAILNTMVRSPTSASQKPAPRARKPATARNTGAPDVFISYRRDERSKVLAIARRLEALKLHVWFDAQMRSGATFDSEIDRQVRAAKAVLVCWSPGAVTSDWVRAEATIGRQRGVLAAAQLKACDLPAPFNLVHTNDLSRGIGPHNPDWLRVVERIGALAGRPGLAAFEALEKANTKEAYGAWIAANTNDALLDTALARLKRL